MELKKGAPADFDRVRRFYWDLIDAMTEAEFRPGWEKGVYPADDLLQRSLENGELYLLLDGEAIAGAMVLNRQYNEGYQRAHWSVEASDDELLVLHALGVHPAWGGRGLAKALTGHAIGLAREAGARTLRLDVLGGNLPAERVYTGMGFRYVDTVSMFYEDTGWTDYLLYEYVL